MASSGSRVLVLRSVEFARNYDVPLHVRSSFEREEGTWITKETPGMEKAIISGVAHKSDEAKVTVAGVPDRPGVAARIFTPLAEANLNVDTIIQNVGADGVTDVSFTVPLPELRQALEVLADLKDELGYRKVTSDDQIGKVTLVGAGMKSNPGVAAKMFRTLAQEGVNIQMIDTSTIRITVVIGRREVERAVRALHDAFDLAGEAARRETAGRLGEAGYGVPRGRGRRDRRRGSTMLRVLEERGFPVTELRPLASERSEGRELDYLGKPCRVGRLSEDASRASRSPSSRPARRGRAPTPPRPSRPAPWSSTTPRPSAWTPPCPWWCPRSTSTRSRATPASWPCPTASPRRWSWRSSPSPTPSASSGSSSRATSR